MMRRVIKVGGSLLLRTDLAEVLPRWISQQREAESLLIVGGGELIDAMRNLDKVCSVDPAEMHWMCVELLETTYQLFSEWFHWPCIETAEAFQQADQTGFSVDTPTLVSVSAFYNRRSAVAVDVDVPCDWRTTTDTIAALLARHVGAEELVLLKSCDVDPTASIEQLARSGVVDEALPGVASQATTIRVEKLD
jgi:aspartokinase-like uncharacterized kinase